ncbi:DNA primase family protein [Erythrobacter sp. HA6-11]
MSTRNPLNPASGGTGGAPPKSGTGSGGGGSARNSGAEWNAWAGRIRAQPDPETDLYCARLALTEMGNAERWRRRHGDDFRFCPEIGWFHWDGRRWALLSEEKDALPAEVMQSVMLTVRAIRNEAALIAASGCPIPLGMGEKAAENFADFANDKQEAALETYLAGDDDGTRAAFLENQPMLDMAIETAPTKRKLMSDALAHHAKQSETHGKLAAVAKLAKSLPDIAIRTGQLDQDRMAINVLNGTLRLVRNNVQRPPEEIAAGKSKWKTDGWKVKRHPHDRADLITKLAPVKYAPSAEAQAWGAFIERVQPDATMRRFLAQWLGLSMTGDISEQKFAFFYGSGRNGKGTAVEAVAHVAGDYAGSIPIESFLNSGVKRRGDQATPDIARLPGVRLLRVSEPEQKSQLNEGLIKMVTGGDPVDARHLNKGFFTFLPDFKMTISGNHKPDVKDTSDGIWRRMQLVPWDVTIPASEVDRSLSETLKGEASGILNWLLAGLCDWRESGLIEPDQVRVATQAYRDQSDELGRFLSATCEVGPDEPAGRCRVKAKQLHDTYLAWCEEAGGAHWKAGGFKKAMLDKGFEQKTSNGVWWVGIRLRNGVDAEAIRDGRWDGPPEPPAGDPGAPAPDDPAWNSGEWEPGDGGVPGDE